MVDILKAIFQRGGDAPLRVPGGLGATSRVLAIANLDLADLLFHAPLLTAIRRRWPTAVIDVLVPEDHAPVVVAGGLARRVLTYQEKQLRPWRPAYAALLHDLQRAGYDVALVMSRTPQPLLETAALASQARLRAGCGHPDGFPGLNLVVRVAQPPSGYIGDVPRRLAPYLDLPGDSLTPGWPLAAERLRQAARLVHFHKPSRDQLLIGFDPSLGKEDHGIAVENLAMLARELTRHLNCRILPLASPAQQARCQAFETAIGGVPPGLTREDLLDTVMLLRQCDLLVAGNTDLFHVAVAHDVPVVGIFTSRDEVWWQPPGVLVLLVSEGQKMDLAAVVAAVANVAGGRGTLARASTPRAEA